MTAIPWLLTFIKCPICSCCICSTWWPTIFSLIFHCNHKTICSMTWLASYFHSWIYWGKWPVFLFHQTFFSRQTSFHISHTVFAVTDWKGQMSQCIDCLLTLYIFSHWVFFFFLSFFPPWKPSTKYNVAGGGAFHLAIYQEKITNSCNCPRFITYLGLSSLFYFFWRCLHNLRSDLCLDSKCLRLCGGGRTKLPSEPVWPAWTNGRTRDHQVKYR